jgi:hypothetical protein
VGVGTNVGGIEVITVKFGDGSKAVGEAGIVAQAENRSSKKYSNTALDMRRIVPVKTAR